MSDLRDGVSSALPSSCSGDPPPGLRVWSGGREVYLARVLGRLSRRRELEGGVVVLATGCFDVLHRGHMGLVRRCQELSGREGVFALGVNADASVRVLKGAGRPVMGLEDRACVLSMLRGVFCVFSFTEPTPEALVRWLRPGVFVKGGDWSESSLPEAVIVRRYGGVVELVELVEGASTTAIVDRVRGG